MTLKKLLPFISAAAIFFIIMLTFPIPIQAAENVPYLFENGTLQTFPEVIDYTGQTSLGEINTTTWYVVTGTQTPSDRINIIGNVYIILADGCHLNASNGGIAVQDTNSLKIYAQSTGADMGRLTAKGTPYSSGIGSSDGSNFGSIIISGGTIDATGGLMGSGIGGGSGGGGDTILIHNGVVNATGGDFGAGIGGGNGSDFYIIMINGGTTNAIGGLMGSGIGGGSGGNGGTIIINTGTVNATGGDFGAGIGGGSNGHGGTIIINNNTVNAVGGDTGAGIGGGYSGSGGTISINGGIVTANGGSGGAGIGSGSNGNGGLITIKNGTIRAIGGADSAGIGGGSIRNISPIIINSGATLTISNGNVTASSIGGGAVLYENENISDGGTVVITGGNVTTLGDAPGGQPTYDISGGSVNRSATLSTMSTIFAVLVGFILLVFIGYALFFVSKKALYKTSNFIHFCSKPFLFVKQHVNLFIECFILTFPLLLVILLFIFLCIFELTTLFRGGGASWQTTMIIMFIPEVLYIISIFIFNIIFYFVLKKKNNFKIDVLFHGIGFTSCCVIFVFSALSRLYGLSGGSIVAYALVLYMLSFILLYYSFATFLQNKEKDLSKVTLYLTAMTFISFAVLIIFEAIQYHIPYVGFFLLLFGLYLTYCLTSKKVILNLQGLAWVLFILSSFAFWYFILYAIITMPF